ncbi:Uncharacterised protein [Clostridioides difficile]|nr:Uncharacterised protein [Clostridioides difficile]
MKSVSHNWGAPSLQRARPTPLPELRSARSLRRARHEGSATHLSRTLRDARKLAPQGAGVGLEAVTKVSPGNDQGLSDFAHGGGG